jgi:Zn finger protein HypA/HybF involved in hydrogenase expression
MHELSMALEVCRLARQALAHGGGGRVLRVGVEVGDDTGLEPENFRFCLNALLTESPFNGASTELIPGPGVDLRLAWVEVDDGRSDD